MPSANYHGVLCAENNGSAKGEEATGLWLKREAR